MTRTAGTPADLDCTVPDWQPPPWPKDCPEPGVYLGVAYEDYRAWPAANATALKHGATLSPKHMRATIEVGTDSRDRKFGRAVHCYFLERERFAERFSVAKPCCAPVGGGERKGQPCGVSSHLADGDSWYCGTHAKGHPEAAEPSEYIQATELAALQRMYESATEHAAISLLRAHGGCEVSLVWDRDGLPCKARLDKLLEKGPQGDPYILDLKKCQAYAIDLRSIDRSIVDYHWDAQAWWYRDGYERLTGRSARFWWVFMEDGVPFDIRPKAATRKWLRCGQMRMESAWQTYLWCVQTGDWRGVSPDVDDEEPPEFYCKRFGIR
jgi:hypothetical protein